MKNESEFNYGTREMNKLGDDSEKYRVKFLSDEGETRHLPLNPGQFRQVRELIATFNL